MRQAFKAQHSLDCSSREQGVEGSQGPREGAMTTTGCYCSVRCCATECLQMAAGAKFSRSRSHTDPVSVSCELLHFFPTLCMSGSPLTPSITRSHSLSIKPGKPHRHRKSIFGGRHGVYCLLFHTHMKENICPK